MTGTGGSAELGRQAAANPGPAPGCDVIDELVAAESERKQLQP